MSNETRASLTIAILEAQFHSVKSLQGYLRETLNPDAHGGYGFTPTTADSREYRSLIETTYVALKSIPECGRRIDVFPPMEDMHDVIQRAHVKLLLKATSRTSNVITAGYRLNSSFGGGGARGITNPFVNTIVTALQAPEWETLLQRIGSDAMFRLLTDTAIFVALPNDCLCQMTGEPVIYVQNPDLRLNPPIDAVVLRSEPKTDHPQKRKAQSPHDDEPPVKRLRLQESIRSANSIASNGLHSKSQTRQTVKLSPADVSFVRVRLFYARPVHVPHTGHIAIGLPPKHILSRLRPSYEKPRRQQKYVDPDPRKEAENARHLAKYVFPRQYGLSSPFCPTIQSKRDAFKIREYSDRENEIKTKGSCKTPKRLKDVLGLLDKIIWRHGKCAYKPLRDKTCPSKIKDSDSAPLDSSVILEMMSEYSSQLRTQPSAADISVDSNGRSIVARGMSQAERHVRHKPRFAEFACSHVEVYRYAALITKAVIPKAFWGCDRNLRHVLRHVKDFISYRRHETVSLHHVLQGFSTSECDWLMPPGKAAQRQARVSVSDALKRRELLEDFIFWYFDSFLLPLLKTTFYVTESSAFRNQVLYFRQDDWEALCAPLIERLTSGTFKKIPQNDAEEILRQRKLGFSFVRLLPKDTGVRPIVNLRRRKPTANGPYAAPEQSINQILQAAFQILTYEKERQPERLGASVFGPNEVYKKLKAFKTKLSGNGTSGALPKLYFVKVDVQACFDTIEQTKLLEILRELISEDTYVSQRYGQVSSVAGKVRRKFVKKAVPEDETPHFLTYAAQLADVIKHTIFVDQVTYPATRTQEILALLEEHITDNIVKIGEDYYRQTIGIPQGSVLSALLCSFFYGDMEKRFMKFTQDLQSLLLRLIDDYLYVTTSLSKAKAFLDMMYRGHPEYGCFISRDKTMTNFDYDAQIMNSPEPKQNCFPWCGYLINMKDLSVSVDYTRYQDIPLESSLTVDKGRRPGATFNYKMLQLAKARSHIIFCDMTLNTEHVVYLNIYQNFALSAMKMHDYIRCWGINPTKSAKFIHDTVRQMIYYAYASIRNKASNSVAKAGAGKCDIQKAPVVWLGTHAFHAVLSRKPKAYAQVIKSLAFEMSLPQHRRSRKRFRGLVAQGLAGVSQINF